MKLTFSYTSKTMLSLTQWLSLSL